MKIPKLIFVSVCLVGLTQFGWSQNQIGGVQRHGAHGSIDPRTGIFTAKVEHVRMSKPVETPLTGTPILFRETFNFTISAADIPAAAVIFCYAEVYTDDDNGDFDDSNGAVATRSGSTATCTVSVLAKWTLANPTTDTISADYEAYAEQGVSIGGGGWEETERYGYAPGFSSSMPANTQTITNTVSITM
jgi:hypothetical protein